MGSRFIGSLFPKHWKWKKAFGRVLARARGGEWVGRDAKPVRLGRTGCEAYPTSFHQIRWDGAFAGKRAGLPRSVHLKYASDIRAHCTAEQMDSDRTAVSIFQREDRR